MDIADEIDATLNRIINEPSARERSACNDCPSPKSNSYQICVKVWEEECRLLWCYHGGMSMTEFLEKYGKGRNK